MSMKNFMAFVRLFVAMTNAEKKRAMDKRATRSSHKFTKSMVALQMVDAMVDALRRSDAGDLSPLYM